MLSTPFPYDGPDDPGLSGPGARSAGGNAPEDDWDADAHLDAVVAAADAGQYEMLPEWSVDDLPTGFAPAGCRTRWVPGRCWPPWCTPP